MDRVRCIGWIGMFGWGNWLESWLEFKVSSRCHVPGADRGSRSVDGIVGFGRDGWGSAAEHVGVLY